MGMEIKRIIERTRRYKYLSRKTGCCLDGRYRQETVEKLLQFLSREGWGNTDETDP